MNDEKTITISKKIFDKLSSDSDILEALRSYGVDNWEGYGDALASLEEEEE